MRTALALKVVRRSTGFIVVLAIAIIAFGVGAYSAHLHLSSPQATTTSTVVTTTTTATTSTTIVTTGEQSPAIVAENEKPGTTAWKLYPGDDATVVQGFAGTTYAQEGQSVSLYITSSAPRYVVQAYRMGYYGGDGARLVWQSAPQVGVQQPSCSLDTSVNMVSCANWSTSLTVPITAAFVPGDYLFKLVAAKLSASYIPLTIWDPTSTATYVVMNRPLVEQGWNTYGGYDFYAGQGSCIIDQISYPVCNRARVVSFDRPYATGAGASDFLTNEYPLVELMEKEGLNVTYITDITLSEHPSLLLHHTVLLSLDHDESWTLADRQAVATATSHGVNVVYFGAAAMVRHVRLEPSALGADRQEVDYRNAGEDPLNNGTEPLQVTSNTWGDPPADWSPLGQIGNQYSGYLNIGTLVPMTVTGASTWLMAGTGLHNGQSIPNAVGSDIDHSIASTGNPSTLEVLNHSPVPTSTGTFSGQTWNGTTYTDIVYFTYPSGAGVLDTGNIIWIGNLMPCRGALVNACPQAPFATMTTNILRLFGEGPTAHFQPAVSNLATIQPTNS